MTVGVVVKPPGPSHRTPNGPTTPTPTFAFVRPVPGASNCASTRRAAPGVSVTGPWLPSTVRFTVGPPTSKCTKVYPLLVWRMTNASVYGGTKKGTASFDSIVGSPGGGTNGLR